jgi:hypothetical protein
MQLQARNGSGELELVEAHRIQRQAFAASTRVVRHVLWRRVGDRLFVAALRTSVFMICDSGARRRPLASPDGDPAMP